MNRIWPLAIIVLSLLSCARFDYQAAHVSKQSFPKEIRLELTNYQYVPSGTFTTGIQSTLRETDPLLSNTFIAMMGFYLATKETTVGEYMQFVLETGDSSMRPDTLCFIRPGYASSSLEYQAQYYFWHPKYKPYPIVGISQIQAEKFLEWKTNQWNKQLQDTSLTVSFRLPTDLELEWAMKNVLDENLTWNTFHVCNTGNQYTEKGELIKSMDDDDCPMLSSTNDKRFEEKGYHHLFGNVAEMTQSSMEDYLFHKIDSAGWINDRCLRQLTYSKIFSGHQQNWDTLCLEPAHARLLQDTSVRISKGGSWFHDPYYCKPAAIIPYRIDQAYPWLGFRAVMMIVPKGTIAQNNASSAQPFPERRFSN